MPAAVAPAPAIEPATEGSVARSALVAVLDQGVGRFLQTVELSAMLEDGRFRGWRIRRFDNPWVDLRVGDLVTTVNGQAIETPAQAQAVWLSLREADAIVVQVVREGAPFELRFQVEGAPMADSP